MQNLSLHRRLSVIVTYLRQPTKENEYWISKSYVCSNTYFTYLS